MSQETLICRPIGIFRSSQTEKYMAPKQSRQAIQETGRIILFPGFNFERALDDLQGFERIWILFWFHRNCEWKAKVATPRGGPKRGVFATRSPYRPNPIGLSCVELLGINHLEINIGKSDLIDGTPILDIKPYLNYADAFPNTRQGWLSDGALEKEFQLTWSKLAEEQVKFLEQHLEFPYKNTIELRLRHHPFPAKSNRIKRLSDNEYELAIKTWRVRYRAQSDRIFIIKIVSGYDQDTLKGKKTSRWDDVPIHRKFIAAPFQSDG